MKIKTGEIYNSLVLKQPSGRMPATRKFFRRSVSGVSVATRVLGLKWTARFLQRFGTGCIVGAVGLGIWWFWPILREEIKYSVGQTVPGKVLERVANTKVADIITIHEDAVEKPSWIVPDAEYSIYIPKILAKSRVIAGVDTGDVKEYQQALLQGVAAAKGLAHPGEVGTTYLFAHSVGSAVDFTRYNAIFYLLHRLEKGDGVEVVYKEKLHKYRVAEKKIVTATDVSYLETQNQEEKLVMQTCYPPGTTWKRLIVVAKPEN